MRLQRLLAGSVMLVLLLIGDGVLAQGTQGVEKSPGEAARVQKKKSVKELTGYNAAKRRLGAAMPTGKGIVMGHVEGGKDYKPKVGLSGYEGVAFLSRSGGSGESGHAQGTAAIIYGKHGMAPGVSRVHLFSANGWMRDGYLKVGSGKEPPKQGIRVFNHSWISNGFPGAEEVLRRVDYLVDRDGVVVVAGVNNGRQSEVPMLMGSGHNVIAVGTAGSGGASSGGYTKHEGVGRVKPDLVGPRGLTSFTTPVVSATAGLLLEIADGMTEGDREAAGRPEVVKAAILTGATKPKHWRPAEGRSLDEHLGAGIVNVDESLKVMMGGRQRGEIMLQGGDRTSDRESVFTIDETSREENGWDYLALREGQSAKWKIIIGKEGAEDVSITVVWNRRLDGQEVQVKQKEKMRAVWMARPRVADFDLRLVKIEKDGEKKIVGLSDSELDNVEHLYFKRLAAGSYELEVYRQRPRINPDVAGGDVNQSGDEDWGVAVAWRMGLAGE
ncbi:S8 family serine peptidase [Poriferisphaera sp. WC338]|uniref:S8 family serine peptidase n=1 Tax=Poriferisphaera sp. WC338 TaxID=3425129 RepID=UPI003D814269